jgi:very-short-patch-repair endonuclease
MPKGRHRVEGVADAGKVAFAREQRKKPTASEAALWQALRATQLGVRFRRQHPIGEFVLDFYCAEACLAVEVDGPVHDERPGYDEWRDERLAGWGIRVLRVADGEIKADLPGVLARIRATLALSRLPEAFDSWPAVAVSPSPERRGGRG